MNKALRILTACAAGALLIGAAPAPAPTPEITFEAAQQRLQALRARAERLEDERAIENLMRSYGFYFDRKMWDDVADLFADDGTFEVSQRGVYQGKDSIRRALEIWGPQGLQDGQMNDHLVLQPVIHVSPDGEMAQGRFRHIGMLGEYQQWGRWEDGVYENAFVKQDGVWKISALHLHTILSTDIEQGWGEQAFPADGPSAEIPADAPPTVVYENYPAYYTPPFHYPNPISGQPVQYREGDPAAAVAQATLPTGEPVTSAPAPQNLDELEAAIAEAELAVERAHAANEIQNLINAYGYYLDKGLYNELADLFAEDGSMELAQRGVYQGRERVREFLTKGLNRGQPDGPRLGFLQDHVQLQPVIHVAEDAQTATARMRMIQMMGFAGQSASWGAGVYVDEFVKEDGRWKFKTAHAYNTFNAAYDGAWVRNGGGALPGQNPDLPPDSPPTLEFEYWPVVYDIPFNYDNPVSGRAPYSYREAAE
jgi:ketosteroid isomerase-like protein